MLNMIRADLYRATRLRFLRGHFWQYAIAIAGIAALGGITSLISLQEGYLSPERIRMDGTLSAFFAGWILTNPSIVGLCCSFAVLEMLFFDLSDGYIKNLASSVRGRLSIFTEKLVFAGVWSLLCLVTSFIVFAILLIVFIGQAGFSLPALDDPFALALWLVGSWLTSWALSSIPLFFALATKRKVPSYIFSFLLGSSSLSIGLSIFAQTGEGFLWFLQPVKPLLNDLAATMPDALLARLSDGAGSLLEAALGPLSFLPNQGLQIIVSALLWLAGASALFLAVARTKSL